MTAAINVSRLAVSKANGGQVKLSRVAVTKASGNSILLSRVQASVTNVRPSMKLSRVSVNNLAQTGGVALKVSRLAVAVPQGITVDPATLTVDSMSNVSLSASANSTPNQWEWTQTSGPSVTLSGNGNTRTFVSPATTAGTQITISVRALFNTVWSDPVTITVTVNRHTWWRKGPNSIYPVQVFTQLDVVPPPPPPPPPLPPDPVDINLSRVSVSVPPVAPPPPPPSGNPDPGLFYAVPSDIRTHTRKVFAHYFGPYPRSLDNASKESLTQYASYFDSPYPAANQSFGGFFRDSPMYRPQSASSTWQVDDCKFDIQVAMSVGMDGFFCDLLGLSGSNFDNYNRLKQALRELRAVDSKYNSFYVMAMIDANGATGTPGRNYTGPVNSGVLNAAHYVESFSDTAYHLSDGRMLWSCFLAEANPPLWWSDVAATMTSDGFPNAFLPVFNNYNSAPNYYSISYGVSAWGFGADPGCINAAGNQALTAHNAGKVYMHPATIQDTRPRNVLYDEACNSEALRATWNKAINQGADFIQMVTWSDFSEAPQAPSTQHGFCVLDVTGYYIQKYKTGNFPEILADALYLIHRDNPTNSVPTGPQTQFMKPWVKNGYTSTPRNTVEVLSFLTAPADITVTIAGVATTYTAQAGLFAKVLPLAVGSAPTAVARRNGVTVAQITSTRDVTNSPLNDDKGYWWFSSIRGTAGQVRHTGPNPPYPDV